MDTHRTLHACWQLLQDFNAGRDLIVGHNFLDFDLPFLYKRSRTDRAHPSVLLSFTRHGRALVYDTMREWTHWNSHAPLVTLEQLADILGVGLTRTEGNDGSRV